MCYDLVTQLNIEKRDRVEVTDVNAILNKSLETGGPYFAELCRVSLQITERELLKDVLNGKIIKDSSGLRRLLDLDILAPDNGNYHFQIPLIQRFVESQL